MYNRVKYTKQLIRLNFFQVNIILDTYIQSNYNTLHFST